MQTPADDLANGLKITGASWWEGAALERGGLQDVPRRLYKYLSSESDHFDDALQDAFVRSRLYYSRTTEFNDPFDAEIELGRIDAKALGALVTRVFVDANRPLPTRQQRKRLTKDTREASHFLQQSMRESTKKIGIHCLAERWNDVLMWSHYTSSHKGVALVYGLLSEQHYFKAFPVRYRPTYPVLTHEVDIFDNIAYHTVLRKNDIWAYEREWRFFDLSGDRFKPFAPRTVVGVIYGLNCHEQTRAKVRNVLGLRAAAGHPPIAQFEVVKAPRCYGLNLRSLETNRLLTEP